MRTRCTALHWWPSHRRRPPQCECLRAWQRSGGDGRPWTLASPPCWPRVRRSAQSATGPCRRAAWGPRPRQRLPPPRLRRRGHHSDPRGWPPSAMQRCSRVPPTTTTQPLPCCPRSLGANVRWGLAAAPRALRTQQPCRRLQGQNLPRAWAEEARLVPVRRGGGGAAHCSGRRRGSRRRPRGAGGPRALCARTASCCARPPRRCLPPGIGGLPAHDCG
mmetsp:Transcript_21159/g.66355  ORF Transcript_21159/g.66355 Transcript_21159/m.66355 type:complete len:218 (+) Transcript_21159:1234-1887(+)